MSYATYLQNKMAAQQKVANVRNPMDASHYTYKKRLESNQVFFADGKGIGTLIMDTTRPTLLQHPADSYKKASLRPADASDYTSYRGAQGISTDAAYTSQNRKDLLCIPMPAVDSSKYKTAGDVTKDKLACDTTNALRDPPLFVDNTIRLSAMVPDMVSGDGCCNNELVAANHTHSEGIHPPTHPSQAHGKRSEIMRAPREFQNQGVGGSRIGAYFNPRSGYVENKHGNDLNVNPRRTPGPWRFSEGAPAHLKINRPTLFNIKAI